ncbi:type I glyceraldehyde-3-phosphate dehydrogenase [Crocinitomicaceae bacterium]|nr:type I glyceraldehyde-3-phosphate dehydrogenase [Crocinitomicaceae bacterium]MDB4323784.1 type I glyceraldehyde-3-phosphate dehydrogenase [Crocinitomicaceae bacterium]
MMKKIGVNGFGRIGRYFTRISLESTTIDVTVVNDLADINTLAHLLKYDSVHRRLKHSFKIEGNRIVFENGKEIIFLSERNPENIEWEKYGVEIVLESTGIFRTTEAASKHFIGGAKKVILSSPAIDSEMKTVVLGVNEDKITDSDVIVSNASCTTNSAAPVIRIMKNLCEIESIYISTIHSYTSDQRLHDAPHEDLRRARAAAESIVPTTTGAAKALAKIFPELDGKIGGCGIRVPVPDGSMTDLTFVVKNPPSVDEINQAMKLAADNKLKGILSYTIDPIVSADIIGDPHSCIFDSKLTSVIGNMIKVVAWYDNESGYSNRLIDLIRRL